MQRCDHHVLQHLTILVRNLLERILFVHGGILLLFFFDFRLRQHLIGLIVLLGIALITLYWWGHVCGDARALILVVEIIQRLGMLLLLVFIVLVFFFLKSLARVLVNFLVRAIV